MYDEHPRAGRYMFAHDLLCDKEHNTALAGLNSHKLKTKILKATWAKIHGT